MADSATELLHEEPYVPGIRPLKLRDFIGQESIKDNLAIFLEAAKARAQSLDHTLFYGPPGLGKTTLAEIIAREMDSNIKVTSGPVITKPGDLAAILTGLKENDVLFIDEIHRLGIAAEEVLYSAMEDFKLDIILGEGPTANNIRLDIPRFTLVGATTRQGLLSNPLRDRFGIMLRLNFYTTEELSLIVKRSASILGTKVTPEACSAIAKRCRGTPRVANNLLRRIRDFLVTSNKDILDSDLVQFALEKLGIDEIGLDLIDRKYLQTLADFYGGGPVGIETLAAVLAESKGTIEDVVEPYLLKEGLIIKTPRGRCLTNASWEHLKLTKPFPGDLEEDA